MAYFEWIIGSNGGGGSTGIPLIVTCDAQFAGSTITATKSGAATQSAVCPSSSPYQVTLELPEDGTWTVSGVVSGQTFSEVVTITPYSVTLNAIPDGATVTPTDDIQTWLHCAGIFDKSYTTINQVLSDTTTLLALISSSNAVDYMVRSTTWASSVVANSTAMTYIGNNNYCANTLLANSTWRTAICNSSYFESVLNTKVPTMTSDTTPSGVVSGTSAGIYYPWHAFDGVAEQFWANGSSTGNISYERSAQTTLYLVTLKPRFLDGNALAKNFEVLGKNSADANWTSYGTFIHGNNGNSEKFVISNTSANKHNIFKVDIKDTYGGDMWVDEIQFYSRA